MKSDQVCADRDEALDQVDEWKFRMTQLQQHADELRVALNDSVDTGNNVQSAAEKWTSTYLTKIFDAAEICRERFQHQTTAFTCVQLCFTRWFSLVIIRKKQLIFGERRRREYLDNSLKLVFHAWKWVVELETREWQCGQNGETINELRVQLEVINAERLSEKEDLEGRLRDMEYRMLKAEQLAAHKEEQLQDTFLLLTIQKNDTSRGLPSPTRHPGAPPRLTYPDDNGSPWFSEETGGG